MVGVLGGPEARAKLVDADAEDHERRRVRFVAVQVIDRRSRPRATPRSPTQLQKIVDDADASEGSAARSRRTRPSRRSSTA